MHDVKEICLVNKAWTAESCETGLLLLVLSSCAFCKIQKHFFDVDVVQHKSYHCFISLVQ